MKADSNGTPTEKVRARMGWMSPAQRKAGAFSDEARLTCAKCKYFWLKEIPSRDGGCPNFSPYCGHPHAAGERGHATRESAVCDRWEMKP